MQGKQAAKNIWVLYIFNYFIGLGLEHHLEVQGVRSKWLNSTEMNSPATGAKLLVNRDLDSRNPFTAGQGKAIKTLWDFFFLALGCSCLLKSAENCLLR